MNGRIHPSLIQKWRTIEQLPFVQAFDVKLISAGEGRATVEMPFRPEFSTPPDLFPAAMVGLLGDVACVFAGLTVKPVEWRAATLDFNVKMLGPASGTSLKARADLLQDGNTLSVARADVHCRGSDGEMHCGLVVTSMRVFQAKTDRPSR